MTSIRISQVQARHAWFAHQGFVQAIAAKRPLADVVSDIGWIPVPTMATPYLAMFARGWIARRSDLDEKRSELTVVPGPKGSSWMVPIGDAPLARAFAVADHASREARVAAAATLTSRDLEGTREALRAALATPVTAAEIRRKIPEQSLRSLGEPGRKSGIATLAALVLRHMWVTGEVMRIQGEGRLDSAVVRWSIDPRPRTVPTAADAVTAIASRWLAAHAPVSAKAFALAFGIAAGRANAALKAAHPVDVEIDGIEGLFLAPAAFTPSTETWLPTRLLPIRDPLVDVQATLLATADAARTVLARATASPSVIAGGEVVGGWTYEPATHAIAWRSYMAELQAELRDQVDEESRRVAAFIHDELAIAPLHTTSSPQRGRGLPPQGTELAIEMP